MIWAGPGEGEVGVVTLRQFECFHQVAASGGFAAAANKPPLGLSRASLYSHVAALQRELGTRLYEVHGKRIRLTDAGQVLHRELDALLASLHTLPALVVEHGAGAVSIAFVHVMSHQIAPIVRAYRARHPKVRIAIYERRPAEVWDMVAQARVDFAVGPPPRPTVPIARRKVAEDPIALVVPRTHRLARMRRPKIEDLIGEPLIAHVSPTTQRQNLEAAFAAVGRMPNIIVEASTTPLIGQLAALGLGVGVTSQLGLDDDTRARLATIPVAHLFGTVEVDILTHPRRYLSQAAREFMEHVARHLESKVVGGGRRRKSDRCSA